MSFTTHSIPRLLDAAPDLTGPPSSADLDAAYNEIRNNAVLRLLTDIEAAKQSGKLSGAVVLFCPKCECFIRASTRVPEPTHHCGAVLEIADCLYCQEPATRMDDYSAYPGGRGCEAYCSNHTANGKRVG